MKFKRNVFTIIYTIIFFALMCFGLFQMTNFTILTANNQYLIAGIIVLGLIAYMILAYFVRRKKYLQFMEKNSLLMNVLEIFVVVVGFGLLFFALFQTNRTAAIIYMLILGSSYVIARVSGGRLCGMLTSGITVALIIIMDMGSYMELQDGIDTLCFLLPFALFLVINRVMLPVMESSVVLVLASYLVMSFLFSLAIAINPLTLILFF